MISLLPKLTGNNAYTTKKDLQIIRYNYWIIFSTPPLLMQINLRKYLLWGWIINSI